MNVQVEEEIMAIIAVAGRELQEFGCPHCGYRSGFTSISGGGTDNWICGDAEDPENPTQTVYGYVPIELFAKWVVEATGSLKTLPEPKEEN